MICSSTGDERNVSISCSLVPSELILRHSFSVRMDCNRNLWGSQENVFHSVKINILEGCAKSISNGEYYSIRSFSMGTIPLYSVMIPSRQSVMYDRMQGKSTTPILSPATSSINGSSTTKKFHFFCVQSINSFELYLNGCTEKNSRW